MGIDYKIDLSKKIIFAHWSGDITFPVLRDYWINLTSDLEAKSCIGIVTDTRESKILFTGEELFKLITSVIEPAFNGKDFKSAVIAHTPLHIGMARQYAGFCYKTIQVDIFKNEIDALNWVSN